jgi:hypothetical protein
MEVSLASVDNGNGSLIVIVDLVGTPLANSNGAEQLAHVDGLVNCEVNGVYLNAPGRAAWQ